MINFLHLSALLSLTSALCLQRNAKKMNGANISPSFYSFFIFFSIFVLSCCFFLLFFLFFLSFFLSYPFLLPVIFFFVCSSCLYLCFALSFLVFLFSFLLFCSSFSIHLFSVPPLSFFRRVRSTAKVPYRQRQASSQILCPLSQSTISVRNLTRHASLCLLHCCLLCKL